MKKNIHFISIGGAIMHQLAIALHLKGYNITGSDDEIYDPSKSELEKYDLLPTSFGWNETNIHENVDAVILGMHARAGNIELEKAKALNIPIYSFPEYVYEQSKNKTRIVIGGSHGKTTTTAMVMHVLKACNIDFDYLVGAKLAGFEYSVKLTESAKFIVIEGDEYLSSAEEMRSKFHFYQPQIALLTGIAHDHINVFPTFESYLNTFKTFIKNLEKNSHLVWCEEDKHLPKIAFSNKNIHTYAYKTPQYIIENYQFHLTNENGNTPLTIIGKHNMQNLAGAKKVCQLAGITEQDFYQAIKTFKGASKRLELLKTENGKAVFLDFAHAPSKVKATVASVAETFADKNLIALFELHTFSSLNKDFLKDYTNTLNPAHKAVVCYSKHTLAIKKMPPLSKKMVQEAFNFPNLEVCTTQKELKDFLNSQNFEDTVLLMMSSGKLGGLQIKDILNFVF